MIFVGLDEDAGGLDASILVLSPTVGEPCVVRIGGVACLAFVSIRNTGRLENVVCPFLVDVQET